MVKYDYLVMEDLQELLDDPHKVEPVTELRLFLH